MNEYEKQLLIANIKESLISKIINIDLDIKDAKTKLELLKHNVEMYQKVLKMLKIDEVVEWLNNNKSDVYIKPTDKNMSL